MRGCCGEDIAPEQVKAVLADLRIVDVRGPTEFTGPLGHLPGAESVPLAALQRAMQRWPRDEPMLLVCHSGRRSAIAAQMLCAAGFSAVHNLAGGMLAWRAGGLPC